MAEDFAALGVQGFKPPDWMTEEEQPTEFGVLPENWEAVNAFLACAHQWHYSAPYSDGKALIQARPIGLRYEALEIVIRHRRVEDPGDCFRRVLVIEAQALAELNRMRK